uniref:Fucosyltransferase n=1 Tax=Kalanchoe fedtschenkoi TaxID=63787 RepID=A0A7N0TDN2_KALFE
MGATPAHRRTAPVELPVSTASPTASSDTKRRWTHTHLLPICVALVVIAEMGFLFRLDVAEKARVLTSWTDSVNPFAGLGVDSEVAAGGSDSCEEWLEREDAVEYSRDFMKEPVWVSGGEQEFEKCAVGCKFGFDSERKPDASFGLHREGGVSVLRSMESAQYYRENEILHARRRGYEVVMTTSLSSDVPVGYFSWAEYDIMAPVQPKTEKAFAAAFISNCAARNFRLQALEALENAKIKIDSYGGCHRNRDGSKVDKVETLKRYKFSLAFENSIEEDYVTEKFFQSLVAGSVPVVVGAPNIQEFAPAPGSILHIREIKDVDTVAERMKYLAANPEAYNQTLRWKSEGPSDSFKALVDMAAVHSSCRLCIYLATQIREKEEKSAKRPCLERSHWML